MATTNDVLEPKQTGLPAQEVIEMTEEELIAGLLAASDFETDEDNLVPVEIRRNKKLFFKFHIHPLSEKEMQKIRKKSTDRYKNPAGKHLPKIEGDIRIDEFRSRKIYASTTDEDRAKLWDNPVVKKGLEKKGKDIFEPWEVIEAVLMAGEKQQISELIDDISGFGEEESLSLDDYAKN